MVEVLLMRISFHYEFVVWHSTITYFKVYNFLFPQSIPRYYDHVHTFLYVAQLQGRREIAGFLPLEGLGVQTQAQL